MYPKLRNLYFIGIGGIGMSALARWFKAKGYYVAGYDRSPTPLTDQLTKEGFVIHFQDDIQQIPAVILAEKAHTLVVYTPAIPADHQELSFLKSEGYQVEKRAKVLGDITKNYFTIAIAGTHGKTSTSSMTGHILKYAGLPCTAFLGGILQDYHSNLLLNDTDQEDIIVVEADEFDRSFLQLYPNWGAILSTDADHLDIYAQEKAVQEAYIDFAKKIPENGRLFLKKDIHLSLKDENLTSNLHSFDLSASADIYAENIRIEKATFVFDFVSSMGKIENIQLKVPGYHNVSNAIVAVGIAQALGVSAEMIRKALLHYRGVERRFEYILDTAQKVLIDDYAHHPTELRALLESVRALYPTQRIGIIFQPHLFSRTRDFAEGFAQSLSLADEVFLLAIYPARELPIEGVSSSIIFDKLTCPVKYLCEKQDLYTYLQKSEAEVLLTVGAGDIAQEVLPIKKFLEQNMISNDYQTKI